MQVNRQDNSPPTVRVDVLNNEGKQFWGELDDGSIIGFQKSAIKEKSVDVPMFGVVPDEKIKRVREQMYT